MRRSVQRLMQAGEAALTHTAGPRRARRRRTSSPAWTQAATGLARYADSLGVLGDCAASYGIRLGIRAFSRPRPAECSGNAGLPRRTGPPERGITAGYRPCADVRRALPDAIAAATSRLCYVHLDDNDGVGDLHLALYDGVLTPNALAEAFAALAAHGYRGRASLELNPALPNPLDALVRSRAATLAAMR